MIDKPKNLKAFKFLPWRMVTFAVFIYPCLYQAKIYTIVIICLFSEIRLQVIDFDSELGKSFAKMNHGNYLENL